MKIEYFPREGEEPATVLIYGSEPEDARRLKDVVHGLAIGAETRVAIHALPGFEGIGGCELFFASGKVDRGLRPMRSPLAFECVLRSGWWDNIEGLLEPFCEPQTSQCGQDLDIGFYSDVRLAISTDRGY